jgi:hypothetical protein
MSSVLEINVNRSRLTKIIQRVLAWRHLARGTSAAAAIGYLYSTGSAVAVESLRAMTLRTSVWLAFWLGLTWLRLRDGR